MYNYAILCKSDFFYFFFINFLLVVYYFIILLEFFLKKRTEKIPQMYCISICMYQQFVGYDETSRIPILNFYLRRFFRRIKNNYENRQK